MRGADECVLAGVIGDYREFRPAAVLASHFRCSWINALPPDAIGRIAVVPDGCVDILWLNGELVVAGPDRTAAVSALVPGTSVIGLRFRPGAATRWLGVPMSELVGRRVRLAEFLGAKARDIGRTIGDPPSPEARMRVMEAAFARLAAEREPPLSDMGFLYTALATESGGRGMAIVLDRLDVSPRTLRRRCHTAFGYGPKTLDRILRFQRFLSLARKGRAGLAALAFQAGYSDQAHLTREVRSLSGFSPAMILSQVAG